MNRRKPTLSAICQSASDSSPGVANGGFPFDGDRSGRRGSTGPAMSYDRYLASRVPRIRMRQRLQYGIGCRRERCDGFGSRHIRVIDLRQSSEHAA
jgi:hypothetical protein